MDKYRKGKTYFFKGKQSIVFLFYELLQRTINSSLNRRLTVYYTHNPNTACFEKCEIVLNKIKKYFCMHTLYNLLNDYVRMHVYRLLF